MYLSCYSAYAHKSDIMKEFYSEQLSFITTRNFDTMDKETLLFLKCIMYENSVNLKYTLKKVASKIKPSRDCQRALFQYNVNCSYSVLEELLSTSVIFSCQKEF